MITFNHGLSGYVCSRVAMPVLRRRSPLPERSMSWAFFLGAMMPDLDILTKLAGRAAYFSGNWYAHRGASHSVLGALVLALVGAAVLHRLLVPAGVQPRARACLWLAGCFWAGGLLHLFGDVFTPGWPLPLAWPLEGRFGALRHIGWFSPYLLWLFAAAMVLTWSADGLLQRFARYRAWVQAAVWAVFALAAYRWVDFLLTSRYEGSSQWYAYQRDLLPELMVTPFSNAVSFLWHWITG